MDSSDGADWEVMARYFAGECSDTEAADVRAWAASSDARGELLERLRNAWDISGHTSTEWDEAAAWNRLEQRMEEHSAIQRERAAVTRHAGLVLPRERYRSLGRGWLLMAAGIATLFVIGVPSSRDLGDDAGSAAIRASQEIATDKGERARMQLADGTRVIIGPESRLEVLPDFGGATREVRLSGEALFDVRQDARRAFLVHARGTITRVMGTEFNVRAYPEEADVRVVVSEGSVRVQPPGQQSWADLFAGDLAEMRPGAAEVVTRKVDVEHHVGWSKGRIAFDRTPLDEVSRELERWYGVTIRVGDPELTAVRLTASFRDQPLDDVLDVIAASLHVIHIRSGNTVVFLSRTPPDQMAERPSP